MRDSESYVYGCRSLRRRRTFLVTACCLWLLTLSGASVRIPPFPPHNVSCYMIWVAIFMAENLEWTPLGGRPAARTISCWDLFIRFFDACVFLADIWIQNAFYMADNRVSAGGSRAPLQKWMTLQPLKRTHVTLSKSYTCIPSVNQRQERRIHFKVCTIQNPRNVGPEFRARVLS